MPLRRQRERLCLYFNELAAEHSDAAIKIRSLGPLEIGEEPPDPGRQVVVEELAIHARLRRQPPIDDPGHDLAQDRDVIFRLALTFSALDPELAQIRAQARQRTLVQEAGQIVGTVGQQLAAPKPDEKIELLALDALG